MKYAVDTHVLREIRHPRGNPMVKAAIAAIADADLFISVIVLGEMWKGVAKLDHGPMRDGLAEWTDYVSALFGDRVLPVDEPVARRWGEVAGRLSARGRTRPPTDGLIAATAFVHDLTLLTRNVNDFLDTDIRILDPWATLVA